MNRFDQSDLIFIFSLPRSGSTLLQRILTRDDRVCAPSEPWILPALLNIRFGSSPISEIAFDHVRLAIQDLYSQNLVSNSERNWADCIQAFAVNFYSNFAESHHTKFVDKTPRNAIFIDEIVYTFPNAKFIILLRNPLDVIASINNTFGNGRWKAYFYKIDLELGLYNLVNARNRYRDDKRFLFINYEDLVISPKSQLEIISEFTKLDLGDETRPIPKIDSLMGDKTGQNRYLDISSLSIGSGRSHYNSVLRRFWVKRYINFMQQKSAWPLEYEQNPDFGPSSQQLINKHILSDLFFILGSPIYHRLDIMTTIRRICDRAKYARR